MQRGLIRSGGAAAVAFGLLWGSPATEIRAASGLEVGIVVEEVGKGSTLEKAGVQAGDVLLAWERLPNPSANPDAARGTIESIFDWRWLVIEQAPRGR